MAVVFFVELGQYATEYCLFILGYSFIITS